MTYEALLQITKNEGIEYIEMTFPADLKGLCKNNKIGIAKGLTITEKKCTLGEELGHYYTTVGNIIVLESVQNRKQERQARKWAYEKLIPLKSLITASAEGCANLYELAEYLDVTEAFLKEALIYYQGKYGLYTEVDNYCIYFSPLTVCKYEYE